MIICAAGDIHGQVDRMYADVLAFEASLGVRFDAVLHVGDFGIWPDPERLDGATRKRGDPPPHAEVPPSAGASPSHS